MEYGTSKGVNNPFLVLESAWHKPQWSLVKDALSQVEQGCPKELVWKLHLYRGFLAICHPNEEQQQQLQAQQQQQQNQQPAQQPPQTQQFASVDRCVSKRFYTMLFFCQTEVLVRKYWCLTEKSAATIICK